MRSKPPSPPIKNCWLGFTWLCLSCLELLFVWKVEKKGLITIPLMFFYRVILVCKSCLMGLGIFLLHKTYEDWRGLGIALKGFVFIPCWLWNYTQMRECSTRDVFGWATKCKGKPFVMPAYLCQALYKRFMWQTVHWLKWPNFKAQDIRGLMFRS